MILKLLKEAKASDTGLVAAIKAEDAKLAELRDSTIAEIINIYKKEYPEDELTGEAIVSWFEEGENPFAEFVFLFFKGLSTYSIADFAEHDERLGKAIRQVLKDYKIIDDEDRDLTTPSEPGDHSHKLNMHQMCTILFETWAEKPVHPGDEREKLPDWVYKMENDLAELKKNAESDEAFEEAKKEYISKLPEPEKAEEYLELYKKYNKIYKDKKVVADVMAEVEEAYHKLFEEAEKCCPECGKCPCECAKEELKEEEIPAEEEAVEVIETEAEEPVELPEEEPAPEIPAEPVVAPIVPEISDEEAKKAMTAVLNDLVQGGWALINQLNSASSTFDYYCKDAENKDKIKAILSEISDSTTINIGMLYKALEFISAEVTELIDDGSEKAEEIIGE